ncbi:MAG: hypothetical protein Q9228_005300 [Teloschistes exilis]
MHTQHNQEQPAIVRDLCARAQCRFSAFFHGQSVLTKERYGPPISNSKSSKPYRSRVPVARNEMSRENSAPRSRTSTFSLIDPISSPLRSPRTPHDEELWHYRGAFFRPVSPLCAAPRPTSQETARSPHSDDETFRRRALAHTRVQKPYDLGLAISGSESGQTFHVAFIVFILLVTMVFCHFLIRLCMLSVRSGQPHRIRSTRRPANGLEEEFAQPETPIPVILARDEEMGLYDDASDDEVPKVIQHPPPAYGLWRSSVVSAGNVLPCLCARLLTFSSVRILTSYTGNESLLPSGSV